MEYTLHVDKWRCGGAGDFQLGEGETEMLNAEGYMCCLGQFGKQKGVPNKYLRYEPEPENVACSLHEFKKVTKRKSEYDSNFVEDIGDGSFRSTHLASELIQINDDRFTTPSEKIKLIKQVLKKEGHTLIVRGKVPTKKELLKRNLEG